MANNIVQLQDDSGNDAFPIAGGMAADSITTQMIQDGAVTSDKIDWTTLPFVYEYTQRSGELNTTTETTIMETTFSSASTTRMLFFTTAVMKTDRQTSFLRIYLDGTVIGSTGSTSSNTYLQKIAISSANVAPGSHTVKVTVIPQDGNTTVSVKSFERMYLIGWCV